MSKPLGKVPENIKKVWEEDRAKKDLSKARENALKEKVYNETISIFEEAKKNEE